jgi:hypothetical protein
MTDDSQKVFVSDLPAAHTGQQGEGNINHSRSSFPGLSDADLSHNRAAGFFP